MHLTIVVVALPGKASSSARGNGLNTPRRPRRWRRPRSLPPPRPRPSRSLNPRPRPTASGSTAGKKAPAAGVMLYCEMRELRSEHSGGRRPACPTRVRGVTHEGDPGEIHPVDQRLDVARVGVAPRGRRPRSRPRRPRPRLWSGPPSPWPVLQ